MESVRPCCTAAGRCLSDHIKYDVVLPVGAAVEGATRSTQPEDFGKMTIREMLQWAARKSLAGGRGLHSSTSQLNLSRVCHKTTPYTP